MTARTSSTSGCPRSAATPTSQRSSRPPIPWPWSAGRVRPVLDHEQTGVRSVEREHLPLAGGEGAVVVVALDFVVPAPDRGSGYRGYRSCFRALGGIRSMAVPRCQQKDVHASPPVAHAAEAVPFSGTWGLSPPGCSPVLAGAQERVRLEVAGLPEIAGHQLVHRRGCPPHYRRGPGRVHIGHSSPPRRASIPGVASTVHSSWSSPRFPACRRWARARGGAAERKRVRRGGDFAEGADAEHPRGSVQPGIFRGVGVRTRQYPGRQLAPVSAQRGDGVRSGLLRRVRE
ncbi:hypothetical protein A4R44_04924 [Amycolatopsis sp. M39]|nr:hypothetical protein A4R44_04924 [Amycolatopsis sp. M39]